MLLRTLQVTVLGAAVALCAPSAPVVAQQQTQQQAPPQTQAPVFRSTVELVRVDVSVVTKDGVPVLGLGVDDFEVWLDGRKRRIVSAELESFGHDPDAPDWTTILRTPGRVPEDARVFILAFDQLGLGAGAVMPVREAVRRFLNQLRPQDMVAMYEFPFRVGLLDITHDHRQVSRALDRVLGMRQLDRGLYSLLPSEITEITASDADTLQRVISRECFAGDIGCPDAIRMEAHGIASSLETEAGQRLGELSRLAESLSGLQGRKTIVLISGGLVSSMRPGGRPDMRTLMASVGAGIANAQANLYVLHLDTTFSEAYSAAARSSYRSSDRFERLADDRLVVTNGLEQLASRAGGKLFSVEAGEPDFAFNRILQEMRAYYVLGVEPDDLDRDGKEHYIRVETTAKGATVRSRTQVIIPKKKL